MRIAFLSAYSGPVKRGIESWVNELATRLAEEHEIVVYQLGETTSEPYTVKTVDIPVDWDEADMTGTKEREYDLDYWSKMLGRFTYKLLSDLMEFEPDIVFPLNGSWELPISRKYCDYSGAKMVLVGHWNVEKEFVHKPDLFVAVSERQAEKAKSFFDGPVEVIPNAVDTKRFSAKGDQYPLDVAEPRILTVGALVESKHILETIRATARLEDVSLVVCGDGDLRDEVTDLGENLLGDRFQLLQLEHSEMLALYRACDLFTLVPETEEAFGIVYLEALASGLGVVSTDDSVRRNIVGEAGFFVEDPSDTEIYAQTLKQALETDFGNIPRTQAEKFSWDEVAKKYEITLQELL